MQEDPARRRLIFEAPVPNTELGVRDVRHAARKALAAYANAETAELVLSELTSNAVAHAGCPCIVGIYESGPCLLIQVQDRSDDQPTAGPPMDSNRGPSGRGLRIVQAVSQNFGVEPLKLRGKIVWATVLSSGIAGAL